MCGLKASMLIVTPVSSIRLSIARFCASLLSTIHKTWRVEVYNRAFHSLSTAKIMKALKLLIIIVLFVVNHSCAQKQEVPPVVEDQSTYYENDNQEERSSVKSTIIFRNDLVFIVDSQRFPGGHVVYYVGKPKMSPNSSTIECEIHKTITYSTNIGSVIWYTKDCHDTITLTHSEQRDLIMRSNDGQTIMTYKKGDPKNSPSSDASTQWIEQYEDLSKRRTCNWRQKIK